MKETLMGPRHSPSTHAIAAVVLSIWPAIASWTLTHASIQVQHCVARPNSMTPGGWNAPTTASPGAHRGPLQVVQNIPLPGPASRFDYQSIDPVARRLFINHMNAGRLVVFDLDSSRVVGEIAGLDRATGVWAVPAHHMVYGPAAPSGDGSWRVSNPSAGARGAPLGDRNS